MTTTPPTPSARDLRYRRIEQALAALSEGDLLLVAEVAEGLDARRRERAGVEIREKDAASVCPTACTRCGSGVLDGKCQRLGCMGAAHRDTVPAREPVTRVLTTREMLAETTGGAPRHG